MQILTSALQFSTQHRATERHEVRENLRFWRAAPQTSAPAPSAGKPAEHPYDTAASPADVELVLLQLLIERLTGRKMKLADVAALQEASQSAPAQPGTAPAAADWGVSYQREEIHAESETMQFAAAGVVRTADGRELQIALSLTMSREFVNRTGLQVRAGAALKDPLVVNFEGNAAQLTQRQFSFDLDADGTREEVPLLQATSAFLALDRNQDGVINDGRELFGTASGDGFGDLAAYDLDHNGWIDEADPVFSRLKLWLPGVENGTLMGLQDRGIGALHLNAAASPFSLKFGAELVGEVRSTGLYLREDGTAGTLQQVDLKV